MDEIVKTKKVEDMIYEIRGKQVMLDSDLAKLYECTNGTKSINLAVKRNIERFPNDIYFQITKEEYDNLKFQIETSSSNEYGGKRKMPFAFTEEGVAMLATVLHTKVASQMSLRIIRAFVAMKKYISNSLIEQEYINNLVLKNDNRLTLVENTLNKFNENQELNGLFFKGQIFDAYVVLMELCNRAKEEIIIVDEYASLELLKLLKDIDKKIILYSSNVKDEHVKKYKKQYNNVTAINCESFHDRFIIIDKKELYHSGASFKDLGKKCFAITEIKNEEMLHKLLIELQK